jgi:predicted outer membrane repeat protein
VEGSTLRARACLLEHNVFFGLHAWQSQVAIEDSTIRGHSGEEGAGLRVSENSTLELRRSQVSSNTSTHDESGGGISIDQSEIIADANLFLGNKSGGHGGAIYTYRSSGRITNCLFAGNTTAQQGGAIDCRESPIEILQCTFARNPGLLYESTPSINCYQDAVEPHPVLRNSISWPEPLGLCVESHAVLLGVDPGFVRVGSFDSTRTLLLETYVGPWHFPDTVVDPGDYRLGEGSPAIDAGDLERVPAGDLAGKVRPCGAGVDLGAYESPDCSTLVSFRRGDVDAGGSFDLSDPIAILGYLFLGAGAPPCLDAADMDDSGSVEISDAIQALGYLFLGGPPPSAPFEACGLETWADGIGCERSAACEG